jgi:predicted GIY-YIG superfamily endonuclease
MTHVVYILECSDATYYTGYTNNLEKRIQTHNAWKWAKYTRWRFPVKLIYSEHYASEGEARKREYQIKQLKRVDKEKLIQKNSP